MAYAKIIIKGNLTHTPELRSTKSGRSFCRLSVAVNNNFGEKKEVIFYNVSAFEKRAETLAKYCCKGDALLVEGRPKLNVYTDKTGETRASIDVILTDFDFCGAKHDREAAPTTTTQPATAPVAEPYSPDVSEDVPF